MLGPRAEVVFITPACVSAATPCQWLEEALVEAFSIRGLGRLAEKQTFAGDNAFGDAIADYRHKVASSIKEVERLFGVPARTMESYEQGRRSLDGAMRALLRIIDREPNAARRAFTR